MATVYYMGSYLSAMADWLNEEEEEVVQVDPKVMFKKHNKDYYSKGLEYWKKQDTNLNGMLGGYVETGEIDLQYSKKVLDDWIAENPNLGRDRCADVACGIGRISIGLLCDYFKQIDLVECVPHFIDKAERRLIKRNIPYKKYTCGAQEWTMEGKYDCLWVQWTLMFLTDEDVHKFLKQCKEHLNENGIVVVKENTVISAEIAEGYWFSMDHSVARTVVHYKELFWKAGFSVEFEGVQTDWDPELIPLMCFILK